VGATFSRPRSSSVGAQVRSRRDRTGLEASRTLGASDALTLPRHRDPRPRRQPRPAWRWRGAASVWRFRATLIFAARFAAARRPSAALRCYERLDDVRRRSALRRCSSSSPAALLLTVELARGSRSFCRCGALRPRTSRAFVALRPRCKRGAGRRLPARTAGPSCSCRALFCGIASGATFPVSRVQPETSSRRRR